MLGVRSSQQHRLVEAASLKRKVRFSMPSAGLPQKMHAIRVRASARADVSRPSAIEDGSKHCCDNLNLAAWLDRTGINGGIGTRPTYLPTHQSVFSAQFICVQTAIPFAC
jgi:hypothetical protein